MENNPFDMYNNVTTSTTQKQKHEEPPHNLQIVDYIEEENEADKSQLVNKRIFKSISGNATKGLRIRQKRHGTIKTG